MTNVWCHQPHIGLIYTIINVLCCPPPSSPSSLIHLDNSFPSMIIRTWQLYQKSWNKFGHKNMKYIQNVISKWQTHQDYHIIVINHSQPRILLVIVVNLFSCNIIYICLVYILPFIHSFQLCVGIFSAGKSLAINLQPDMYIWLNYHDGWLVVGHTMQQNLA